MSEANKEKLEEEKVDFSIDRVVSDLLEMERCTRSATEVKIFFLLKDLIKILDKYCEDPQDKLKLIGSGYKRTLNHFQIGLYSVDQWSTNIIDGLSQYIECQWRHELNSEVVCAYTQIEALKDFMYIVLFEIESEHIKSSDIEFFYET